MQITYQEKKIRMA